MSHREARASFVCAQTLRTEAMTTRPARGRRSGGNCDGGYTVRHFANRSKDACKFAKACEHGGRCGTSLAILRGPVARGYMRRPTVDGKKYSEGGDDVTAAFNEANGSHDVAAAVIEPLAADAVREELERLRQHTEGSRASHARHGYDALFSNSAPMRALKAVVDRVAGTDATVLVWGESGVGKEMVTRALHQRSPRRDKPFVKVNCAALPLELLESELFGYERGAFTGAHRQKPGKFELAHTGTIFLDEIAEIPAPLQAKLLQVLQDREFARLGSRHDIRVDVRVIAATNK